MAVWRMLLVLVLVLGAGCQERRFEQLLTPRLGSSATSASSEQAVDRAAAPTPGSAEPGASRAPVRPSAKAPRAGTSRSSSPSPVWSSPEACQQALREGRREPRAPGVARLGSWNVRWFPDGKPGAASPGEGTDLEWLACVVHYLDVDALAVQEFKADAEALERWRQHLEAHGGKYALTLDDCPGVGRQHVGILVRTDRVEASPATTYGELNPLGSPCSGGLRPGLGQRLSFPGGLDLTLIAVHLDSGETARDWGHRRLAPEAMGAVARRLAAELGDGDVVFAGDFNVMGCGRCRPRVSASEELEALSRAWVTQQPSLRHIASPPACTWAGGKAAVLDHFVSADLAELPSGARAVARGLCERSCQQRRALAYERLSDHCPVLLDIPDRDLD